MRICCCNVLVCQSLINNKVLYQYLNFLIYKLFEESLYKNKNAAMCNKICCILCKNKNFIIWQTTLTEFELDYTHIYKEAKVLWQMKKIFIFLYKLSSNNLYKLKNCDIDIIRYSPYSSISSLTDLHLLN
jgi:hypothetical protein